MSERGDQIEVTESSRRTNIGIIFKFMSCDIFFTYEGVKLHQTLTSRKSVKSLKRI